jgi:hypothetical protein
VVEAIYCCVERFSPESKLGVGCIDHATHGLHYCAVDAFCHSVHLLRVSGGKFLLYSFALEKSIECMACILLTPVATECADFRLGLSFQLADKALKALKYFGFLRHTEDYLITSSFVLE